MINFIEHNVLKKIRDHRILVCLNLVMYMYTIKLSPASENRENNIKEYAFSYQKLNFLFQATRRRIMSMSELLDNVEL